MAVLIKTLTLTLETTEVHCQLSRATLTDNPTTEEVQTFCGNEVYATPNYVLSLGGFQDWGSVNAVCDIIHTAYVADPVAEIDWVLEVGTKSRSGTAKPTKDVDFGGDAGSALKWETELTVVGTPTEGTVTP